MPGRRPERPRRVVVERASRPSSRGMSSFLARASGGARADRHFAEQKKGSRRGR